MSQVLIVTGAAALASMAPGQLANVTSATHAASTVPAFPPPSAPAMPRPDPTVSTAAGQGQGRAGSDFSASPAGVNANAATHASGQGQANGLSVGTGANDQVGASLRTDETVRTIEGTGFAGRDRMTAEVEAQVDASNKAVAGLRARADAAGDKAHAAFAHAMAGVRKQERRLRADLRAAKGTSEATWGSVQSDLAKSYGAYAHAVAEAELAAQASAETK